MQESWYCPSLNFFVQPLCPLCLCGYRNARYNNHRDTENTEVAQRRVQIRSLPIFGVRRLGTALVLKRQQVGALQGDSGSEGQLRLSSVYSFIHEVEGVQMLRNTSRLLGYLAPIALVALSAPQVFAQKTTVVSAVNAPLSLSLTADSNIVTACADGGAPHVKLTANAVSPGGYPMTYLWKTSAGTVIGEGPVVEWNLAGLKPGYHKASLDIESVGSDGSWQGLLS